MSCFDSKIDVQIKSVVSIFLSCFRVNRGRGLFGDVAINWQAVNSSNQTIESYELSQVFGTIYFKDSESFTYLEIFVNNDGYPELNETFIVNLTSIAGN